MEFNFDEVGSTIRETFKKKPVIIFGIVGAVAALAYMFMRRNRSGSAPIVIDQAVPQTGSAPVGSGSSDAQLYNDVYGLVKQVQEQTLSTVESMIEQSNRNMYDVFSADLENVIENTNVTLTGYQTAIKTENEFLKNLITESMSEVTKKFVDLSGDVSDLTSQINTALVSNVSAPAPKEPEKTVTAPTQSTTPAPAKVTTPAPAKVTTPAPAKSSSYTGPSIVDYLKSIGKDSSYSARAQLAKELGISDYRGTAAQNTQMLAMLRDNAQTTPQKATSISSGSGSTSSGGGGGRGGGGAF